MIAILIFLLLYISIIIGCDLWQKQPQHSLKRRAIKSYTFVLLEEWYTHYLLKNKHKSVSVHRMLIYFFYREEIHSIWGIKRLLKKLPLSPCCQPHIIVHIPQSVWGVLEFSHRKCSPFCLLKSLTTQTIFLFLSWIRKWEERQQFNPVYPKYDLNSKSTVI